MIIISIYRLKYKMSSNSVNIDIKLLSGDIIQIQLESENIDNIDAIKDSFYNKFPNNPKESISIFKYEDFYCVFIKKCSKVNIIKKDIIVKDSRGNTYTKFDFIVENNENDSKVSFYEKTCFNQDETHKYFLEDDVKCLVFNERFELISRKNMICNTEELFQKIIYKFPDDILVL